MKHLNVAIHSRSGCHFFFEHLIDVFCYLLSFCYLLAEWLTVNMHMRTDQPSGRVFTQWSLLWWLLKGEPISWLSHHSVVIRFEKILFPAQKSFLSHCILVWKGIWTLFAIATVHTYTHTFTRSSGIFNVCMGVTVDAVSISQWILKGGQLF